jgi:L-lactate dehydrogenase complex protein LldE
MRPNIGFAALRLLESAGCEVVVPSAQTCCGQPNYNSGDRIGAKKLAQKLISEFESCEHIVIPSGSCSGMIRTHYADLFTDDPELRQKVDVITKKTFELTDFLTNIVKLESIPSHYNGTITYHDSCSGLREMGVKQQPRQLLEKIQNIKLKEMEDAEVCCGFGGTFSIKYGDISTHLADQKCRNIESCGADAVVLGDLGCMLNIEGRLHRRGSNVKVFHIAEILADQLNKDGDK